MKRNLILLGMLLTAMPMFAEQITADQALLRMQHESPAQINDVEQLVYTSANNQHNTYYAYNRANGGFVLLSADNAMPAVLGYTDKGTFNYSELPSNLRWYLSLLDHVAPVQQHISATAVQPLLGAIAWDQDYPFNYLTPTYEEDGETVNCATGCVATAMAQIMRYYCWPAVGTGSHSYSYQMEIESGVFADETSTLSSNFAQHHYDWDNMLEVYSFDEEGYGDFNEAQQDAVALLLLDCGVASEMIWGTNAAGGSGTQTGTAMEGWINYLGYSSDMQLVYAADYSATQWEQLIYDELASGRPVMFGGNGADGSGGHEFVCDGFNQGLFHINWGWSGQDNGYFAINGPGLMPGGSGSGGAGEGASYGYDLEAVIGIRPNNAQSIISSINPTAPGQVFDIFGRPASQNHQGIVIRKGGKSLTL